MYRVLFQEKLSRVIPKMEEVLQFSLDRIIRDWYLLKEHTIIRVYGFVHDPYILPKFLTPRILSLEFTKKNFIMEIEHFLSFRKASKIKFPLKVRPFIIKNKFSLQVVEGFLQHMNFMKDTKINNDPHHIISQRRKQNKNREFDHQEIQALAQRAKLIEYLSVVENSNSIQENPST